MRVNQKRFKLVKKTVKNIVDRVLSPVMSSILLFYVNMFCGEEMFIYSSLLGVDILVQDDCHVSWDITKVLLRIQTHLCLREWTGLFTLVGLFLNHLLVFIFLEKMISKPKLIFKKDLFASFINYTEKKITLQQKSYRPFNHIRSLFWRLVYSGDL